jgi:hypothetical protein
MYGASHNVWSMYGASHNVWSMYGASHNVWSMYGAMVYIENADVSLQNPQTMIPTSQ